MNECVNKIENENKYEQGMFLTTLELFDPADTSPSPNIAPWESSESFRIIKKTKLVKSKNLEVDCEKNQERGEELGVVDDEEEFYLSEEEK